MVSGSASRAAGPQRSAHARALVLGGAITLFVGAVLADVAYTSTYHVQWVDFAAWLNVGALAVAAVALLLALVDLARAGRGTRDVLYAAVLTGTWVAGLFSALMHARDAWASMPGGLVLSTIAAVLACVAAWLGLAARTGAPR